MRVAGIAVLSSLVVLLTGLGSYSQPSEKPEISFSLAYKCDTEENGEKTLPFCLADSFDKELNVVLVSKIGKCRAKTGDNFDDQYASNKFKATGLTGTEDCLNGEDRTVVAIIGTNPSTVDVVEPNTDKSLLTKDMELKAREIARSRYQALRDSDNPSVDVADSPPDVFSAGNAAFLLFRSTEEFLNQDGLPVLVLNSNAFLLQGTCAFGPPFFFTVKEKLHVAYWATVACCGCGDSNFFIYDVSGASPKLVYHNSDFSD
jgi:hypothetical protein